MAEQSVTQIVSQLKQSPLPYEEASSLLSRAKIHLLHLNALTPTPTTPAHLLPSLDRSTSKAPSPPFVLAMPPPSPDMFSISSPFTSFLRLFSHPRLRSATREVVNGGSYDRVWNAMQSREVPCDEYSVFSEILTSQIRSEIASSSERAYPSLPLSSTKSLLFLESEGAVIDFARERRWVIRDGHIYFPDSEAASEQDSAAQDKDFSRTIIENTLGYARELETIV
ncbi:unnamed protein product [Parascedosporium putredinis]|uniref:CSN8/PSMD8/EIF3K domain-containing protein n=1 Tax=Parascedosporium putredinis TaxID=1442378 RepID=A0A9P1H0F6_9PEZI|nr:unnamed protein product [Parascedosporium putredinis]CAI7992097.1 unnamed protein product [Parascedosporium putredinis]